jgi:hypothetical protein
MVMISRSESKLIDELDSEGLHHERGDLFTVAAAGCSPASGRSGLGEPVIARMMACWATRSAGRRTYTSAAQARSGQ